MRQSPGAGYFFTHFLRERGPGLLRSIFLLLASPEESKKTCAMLGSTVDRYRLMRQFMEPLDILFFVPLVPGSHPCVCLAKEYTGIGLQWEMTSGISRVFSVLGSTVDTRSCVSLRSFFMTSFYAFST